MKSDAPTPERIMQLAWGYAPTLILEVAVIHKIFDYLDEAGRTVAEVATHAVWLTRMIAEVALKAILWSR